jgi:hypothetical protein
MYRGMTYVGMIERNDICIEEGHMYRGRTYVGMIVYDICGKDIWHTLVA